MIGNSFTDASRILMQFHITGRCNLRCKHCYRTDGDTEMLSFDDICTVVEQYRELRFRYNTTHCIKKMGHINITGGEPFIREDIKDVLRLLGAHREEFSYGILSNGSFVDDGVISVLTETGASFVQLSLDGSRELHDSLRAPGDYDRVLRCAKYLEKSGIRTYISFTANRQNMFSFSEVARECRRRGVTKLWSDRLVPIGSGEELSGLSITARELPCYIDLMKKAGGGAVRRTLFKGTEIAMNRALQFMGSGGDVYSCSAGDCLITVDEFGDVMPCRRMPIKCGNVRESTLSDIYYDSEVFRDLRGKSIPLECSSCEYKYSCRGGARCQSYAEYGTYLRADPACPLKKTIFCDKEEL